MIKIKRREERNKAIMLQHLKRNQVYKPWRDVLILQIRAGDQGKEYTKNIVCRIRKKKKKSDIDGKKLGVKRKQTYLKHDSANKY